MKRLSKLDIIKRVVEEQQCVKISMVIGVSKRRMVWLDIQTANLLLKVFERAPMENKTKLEALPWDRLVSLGWGCVA